MSSGLTIEFVKQFGIGLWVTSPLLLSLAAAIGVLGYIVGGKEGWSRTEAFYWSFITATTVVLSGIIVAIAVRATTLAFEKVRG